MRSDHQILAGACAVAAAAVLATQVAWFGPDEPPAEVAAPAKLASPARVAAPAEAAPVVPAAPPLQVAPAPDGSAGLAAEITRLTAALNDRQAAFDQMQASLGRGDAALAEARATLAARDAEIRELHEELTALRAQAAFDEQLATLKAAAEPAPAPIPATARRPASADTLLADIQFDRGSSRLTPGAHMRGLAAAATLDTMQLERIRVVGHADTVGSPERNRVLSLARAKTVADLLVANGVPAALVVTAGMGWDDLPIATPAQTAEPLNRSVSIIAVPTRLASAAP